MGAPTRPFWYRAGGYALSLEFVDAVRSAVEDQLSDHQRQVFIAIVVNRVPAEALAITLGSTRNTIYKALYDARQKLHAALLAKGYFDSPAEGGGTKNMTSWGAGQ